MKWIIALNIFSCTLGKPVQENTLFKRMESKYESQSNELIAAISNKDFEAMRNILSDKKAKELLKNEKVISLAFDINNEVINDILNQALQKNFPKLKIFETTDKCVICTDNFENGEYVSQFPCSSKHISHSKCAKTWLLTKSQCPVCRTAVRKIEMVYLRPTFL